MTRSRLVLTGLFVALSSVAVHVQRRRTFIGSGSGSTSSHPVSATVVEASWSHDEDHAPVLELLILLRGSPGWCVAPGPGTNGYQYSTGNGRAINHTYATAGSVTVSIDTDSAVPAKKLVLIANLVTVADRQLAPDEANVILVDGVDTPQPSVDTLAIDPRQPGDSDAVTRAITNTPRLRDFIQCGTTLPDTIPGVPDLRLRMMRAMSMMPQVLCSPQR